MTTTTKVRLHAIALLLCLAIPAFGRVLSYSPYTNHVAEPGFHLRNTRNFLLLETTAPDGPMGREVELVLYNTEGEDPRVLTPGGDVVTAALFEPSSFIIDDRPDPVILAYTTVNMQSRVMLSNNAGRTWKEVEALRGKYLHYENSEADIGGPWVHGLSPAIRIGNDITPFILQTSSGIFAVNSNGTAKSVLGGLLTIVGQNRFGSELLVIEHSPVSSPLNAILSLDVNTGDMRIVASSVTMFAQYTGWIADDGTTYLLTTRGDGRFLYRTTINGTLEFIAGPRDVAPPGLDRTPTTSRDPMNFIAVPTHDFNGAWMAQRGSSSRLLRYTPASGLEVHWSDPSQPEIEALIAGESGQSVLVQVHRDRSVEQVPFVDPALAVWRLGEPMPTEYDELYLNEELNKGFVHVEVDKLRDGDRFVFNSGSFEVTDEGPISPPIGGGGDVIQEWGVVQASLKQHLILPGVARLQGGFGSEWRTDVTMYNPLMTAQQVDIEYVPMYEAESSSRTITITLQPREIRFVPDALQSLYLLQNGGGTLHFRPAVGMNVVGRTYSRSGEGTYGFGMTAIDAFNAAGPRFTMTFAGAFPGENFRTNILLTDTSGKGAAATLSAFGVNGAIGSQGSIVAAPAGGTFQANGIHTPLNLLGRDSGGLVIQPTRGTAIATVVAIDNRTNDPTYFPPDLSANQIRTIPVIGHTPGANGAQFRSDLYLYNPSPFQQNVVLEAARWNSPVPFTRQFTLLPREARVIRDALKTLWNMEGVARLRYWSSSETDGVRVTSRTYTLEQDGSTYGTLIPPLNNFQMAAAGDHLEIIGATAGPGFRTNLGLVELSPANGQTVMTSIRVRIFNERLEQLDSFTTLLQRASGVQINDLFNAQGITPPAAALIVVEVLDAGLVGAYATLTDNTTNDTTYFGAQLGAKP